MTIGPEEWLRQAQVQEGGWKELPPGAALVYPHIFCFPKPFPLLAALLYGKCLLTSETGHASRWRQKSRLLSTLRALWACGRDPVS